MSTDPHNTPSAEAGTAEAATAGLQHLASSATGQAASPAAVGTGERASAAPAKPPGPAAGSDRLAREAAALRANLHRRKQQARQRQQATGKDRSEPQT